MAVQRAWVKQEGIIVTQLSDEQMDEFMRNALYGLYRLAVAHINEGKTEINEKSSKNSAGTAVGEFVDNV